MDVIRSSYKIELKKTHFVALGCNLSGSDGASPQQMCERAIRAIASLPEVNVDARSRWFSTAPMPASDQPRYINGVVRLHGAADPARLLADLHAIESAFGRVRGAPNAARTLDLDILDMAGLVRAAPDPILPHPRLHLRAFVLRPLRDVAPGWVHPVTGATVEVMLAAIPPQDIRQM